MSGGHFEYAQYRIEDIAVEIEHLIESNNQVDKYGNKPDYPPDIVEKFREAVIVLRRGAKMAQRIDWLVSQDDSENSFRLRWKEDGL